MNGVYLLRHYKKIVYEYPEILRGPNIDSNKLIKFMEDSKEFFQNDNVKKRIERDYIDFYLLNEEDFNRIQTTLKQYVVGITSPDDAELTTLLENTKYTLCDKLPHDKYRYKITFKDMPVKVRNDLIAWAERYTDNEIYITKSTRNHFKSVRYHYGTHYFYVKDSKMITLVAMAASGYIRRTDEYVVRNSINTESNQESLCQP